MDRSSIHRWRNTRQLPPLAQGFQSGRLRSDDRGLSSHPAAKVKTKGKTAKVKFIFSSSAAGATFKCKLDKGGWKPCTSPTTFKVKPGKHVFQVEAINSVGTDPTPAIYWFKVARRV